MINRVEKPGAEQFSSAEKLGQLLAAELKNDPNFYVFSPDETTSNKIFAVYDASPRAWNLPTENWDLPEAANGRVVELLSENVLFSTLVGHLLVGGTGMLVSYEAFLAVITSQILQHLKFLQQANEVAWRPDYPAVNLVATSTCWRQDHNGFSHQSPALISQLLALPSQRANCLFPIDDVATEAAFRFMTESRNVVNLMTINKTEEPRWIDSHHADFQFDNGGASIFGFASYHGSATDYEPDLVITAAGDIVSREALLAVKRLRSAFPELKIRFVGVSALSYRQIGTADSPLSQETFDAYFGHSCPIIANFHGYPDALRNILREYTSDARLSVHGFSDQGTTTTPFQMLALNQASSLDLTIDALETLVAAGKVDASLAKLKISNYREILRTNALHAVRFGADAKRLY